MKAKTMKEFLDFIREYNIIALAIGFVMGAASNQLVKSLVDNIIMPLIAPLVPDGRWQEATLQLGPIALKWGVFAADLLNFIILAAVVFIVVKKIMPTEK